MVKVIFDTEKKEWRPCLPGEDGLSIDGYLKEKLDNIKMIVRKNFDGMFIICGEEGSGKSTLAFICGQYLADMGLTINNIAEGSMSAIEKINSMPDKSILICDEAELLFSSRETMSREQRQLTQIMKVVRQKNMIFILVTPVFFDLSKYIAVDRAKFVIRTYTNANLDRGFFCYWGKKKKIKLYENGKKHHGSYSRPKAQFYGRFTDYKLPFEEEYQKLKRRSLDEAIKGKPKPVKVEDNEPKKIPKSQLKPGQDLIDKAFDDAIVSFITKNSEKYSTTQIAGIFGVPLAKIEYLKRAKVPQIPRIS